MFFLITTENGNYRALERGTIREVDPSQYDKEEIKSSSSTPDGVSEDSVENLINHLENNYGYYFEEVDLREFIDN